LGHKSERNVKFRGKKNSFLATAAKCSFVVHFDLCQDILKLFQDLWANHAPLTYEVVDVTLAEQLKAKIVFFVVHSTQLHSVKLNFTKSCSA
jgi:hypothetical protein